MSESKKMESNKSSNPLRRPGGSILAPSRLAFGIGGGSDNASASSGSFGNKVAFSGLKASKLSSVTQAICNSHKSEDEASNAAGTEKKPPATVTPPSIFQKPSFIPLVKEPPESIVGESSVKPPVVPTTTSFTSTSEKPENKDEECFVFGQNLNDRAANYSAVEKSENGSLGAAKPSTAEPKTDKATSQANVESTEGNGDKERAKTLSESAAEYCENRHKKVEFGEVELITGEENETNVFQMSSKLYVFEKTTSSWIERGRGQLRLNDLRTVSEKSDDEQSMTSRIIMRTVGSLRVILNSKIFPEMTIEKPTDKNIRLTATAVDEVDQGLKIFLLSGSSKDIGTLFVALTRRLETVKKLHKSKSTPPKRKHSEEDEPSLQSQGQKSSDDPPPAKEARVIS